MTREQFITLVEREQEALRGFLLALCCGNKGDADDLAQDALVKAYLSSAGYQDRGCFRSWLFKIAHNTFLNHRASLRTAETLDEARTLVSPNAADCSFEHQSLYLALRALSPKERSAITLYYLQRLRHQGDCRHHRCLAGCREEATLAGPRQTERKTQVLNINRKQ